MSRLRSRCSFCLQVPPPDRRLVAGPGVVICSGCIGLAADLVADIDHQVVAGEDVPLRRWESMTDAEILQVLPEVAAVQHQVNDELHRWVAIARARSLSWTRIGTALQITRQTAWQRFATDNHQERPQ